MGVLWHLQQSNAADRAKQPLVERFSSTSFSGDRRVWRVADRAGRVVFR